MLWIKDIQLAVYQARVDAYKDIQLPVYQARVDAYKDIQLAVYQARVDAYKDIQLAVYQARMDAYCAFLDAELVAKEAAFNGWDHMRARRYVHPKDH